MYGDCGGSSAGVANARPDELWNATSEPLRSGSANAGQRLKKSPKTRVRHRHRRRKRTSEASNSVIQPASWTHSQTLIFHPLNQGSFRRGPELLPVLLTHIVSPHGIGSVNRAAHCSQSGSRSSVTFLIQPPRDWPCSLNL
jgi:hypothetical protein